MHLLPLKPRSRLTAAEMEASVIRLRAEIVDLLTAVGLTQVVDLIHDTRTKTVTVAIQRATIEMKLVYQPRNRDLYDPGSGGTFWKTGQPARGARPRFEHDGGLYRAGREREAAERALTDLFKVAFGRARFNLNG